MYNNTNNLVDRSSKFAYNNQALENDQGEATFQQNHSNGNLPTSNGVPATSPAIINVTEYNSNGTATEPNQNGYYSPSQSTITPVPQPRLAQAAGGLKAIKQKISLKHNPLPPNPTKGDIIKNALACPPHGLLGDILTWIIFTLITWGALVSILGDTAIPEGNIFSILALLILAHLGGMVTEKMKLPPLLGMLIMGVMLRSVPGLNLIGNNIDGKWSAVLRKMALVTILTRAGLGLDPKALRALSLVVIRMGLIPNLVEMATVAVVSHYLMGFPWMWSFLVGFIFSAVSPSVVVPCMISLSDRKLGTEKGVPTLVIAGLSIDNALSISGIGVFMGIIFSSEGSLVWQALKGPVQVATGIAYGIVMGTLCWYIPNRFQKGYKRFRFYFLFAVGLLSVFGAQKLNFGGAGAMGCLCGSFVAGIGWRNQGWKDNDHPVKKDFNFLWYFFQPLLFGLIGTEIQISALSGAVVGWGALLLAIGLFFRFWTCFTVVQGSCLNLKEKFFASISWIPKATIQAAFGSAALDLARSLNENPDVETPEEAYGKTVLTLAVLAIVLAAPIGAICIMTSAPKLLKQEPTDEEAAPHNNNTITLPPPIPTDLTPTETART